MKGDVCEEEEEEEEARGEAGGNKEGLCGINLANGFHNGT